MSLIHSCYFGFWVNVRSLKMSAWNLHRFKVLLLLVLVLFLNILCFLGPAVNQTKPNRPSADLRFCSECVPFQVQTVTPQDVCLTLMLKVIKVMFPDSSMMKVPLCRCLKLQSTSDCWVYWVTNDIFNKIDKADKSVDRSRFIHVRYFQTASLKSH